MLQEKLTKPTCRIKPTAKPVSAIMPTNAEVSKSAMPADTNNATTISILLNMEPRFEPEWVAHFHQNMKTHSCQVLVCATAGAIWQCVWLLCDETCIL